MPTSSPQPLEEALGNFVAMTAKSTIAVVIPLYGYWNDIPDNPVNGEVLSAVLQRVYSHVHQLILIFVANPESIEHTPTNPESVANILMAKNMGGNVLNISVPRTASYGEYVTEGMVAALEETKAQFIVVINPWVLIQDGCVDVVVDRANYGDNAKIVSGFDMRAIAQPETFDSYKPTQPIEEWNLSFNFLGMPRYIAEMLTLDHRFKTHLFLERDMWQQMSSKGFGVIASQRVPIFPFDFPWASYEALENFQEDEKTFEVKWGFNPGMKYEDQS